MPRRPAMARASSRPFKTVVEARKEAAEKTHVSEKYVVQAAAIKKADPATFEKLKTGKTTIRKATAKKRERPRELDQALNRIGFVMGEEARDMIMDGQVKIKPKQLIAFANQTTTAIKTIWPLMAEGLPYTDAIKSTGGAVLTLSSTLDHLTAKWVEECGTRKENKVLTISIDVWRFGVERIPGRPITGSTGERK